MLKETSSNGLNSITCAWGKLADICKQFLAKGRKVYVEGRIQTREWEAQDGAKRNRSEIVADNMIMLDRTGGPPMAGAPGAPAMGGSSSAPAPSMSSPSNPPADAGWDKGVGDQEIRIEDIPF
jgi:single-strand DNA-binding protein